MPRRPLLIALFLTALAHTGCGAAQAPSRPPTGSGSCAFGAPIVRTELFFGRDRVNAPEVSDEEWARFVDTVITPLFKDGLTVVDVDGQYLATNGALIKERSKLVVLLHEGRAEDSSRIEQIRDGYRKQFAQESVLRVDAGACAAF